MAFKSYENSGSNEGVMLEGDYEVQLVKCAEGVTKTSGVPCIDFDFVVRSDVVQKYQRKHIFKKFYKDDRGLWPNEKIGKLANALGIAKDQEFELYELVGRCCILHMKPFARSDGTMFDSIYYSAQTKVGQIIQSAPTNEEFTPIDYDDELPFS